MANYNSVVVAVSGVVDGVNTVFTTPSRYMATTIRMIVNGQIYEPDDDSFGWTELSDLTIQFLVAPEVGDIIQAFYLDKDSEGTEISDVQGTPFDPNGILT